MKFTYLLVDFLTVAIPLLFSFHPKLKFYKTWRYFFPAAGITSVVFILWDAWFTREGVWGFNPAYLTGIMIGNLPMEEVLFFICIPYACVFTFHCLDILLHAKPGARAGRAVSLLLVVLLVGLALYHRERAYTITTFLSLAIVLSLAAWWARVSWLGHFYLVYAILLFPFLVVNGVLTGTGPDKPVVWYNEAELMGPRILTIPVEDIFYGMALVLVNLLIYRYLMARDHTNSRRLVLSANQIPGSTNSEKIAKES